VPRTLRLRIGRGVPHSYGKASPNQYQMLYRNGRSRLTILSSFASQGEIMEACGKEVGGDATATPKRAANIHPTGDCAKEAKLAMTPLRVRSAEYPESKNVDTTSTDSPFAEITRLSWTPPPPYDRVQERLYREPGEARHFNRVPHTVACPHPSSSYAHHMPSTIPQVRRPRDERPAPPPRRGHSASRRRVMSAD